MLVAMWLTMHGGARSIVPDRSSSEPVHVCAVANVPVCSRTADATLAEAFQAEGAVSLLNVPDAGEWLPSPQEERQRGARCRGSSFQT